MAEVRVTLAQPVALGAGPSRSSLVDTHWHIPGTVLRGALAGAWIRAHGRPQADRARSDQFTRLFERDVFFGPLFAPGSVPRPLSTWSHKYPTDTCAQSEWDASTEELPAGHVCPTCEQPLERARGEIPRPSLYESAHVELTEQGTPRKGALFSRLEMSERQTFIGHVTGGWTEELTFDEVWLGGGKSVRGLAEISVDQAGRRPLPEMRADRTVVLRLLSPGIFVDHAGRPSQDPDPGELATRLGVDRVTVTRRWVRWTRVHGWHAASDLPKPMEHAVCAGSVFVVDCATRPDDSGLRRLADEGLGLRRTEGYGVIGGAPPRQYTLAAVRRRTASLHRLAVTQSRATERIVIPAIETRARELRAGLRPSDRLDQIAAGIPDEWRGAMAFVASLTDPDQLDAVAAMVRGSLRTPS